MGILIASHITCAALGLLAGLLIYRRNFARLRDFEVHLRDWEARLEKIAKELRG